MPRLGAGPAQHLGKVEMKLLVYYNTKIVCVCLANKCVQPEIEDGSFTPFKVEYDVGNKVNFVCDDGFVLVGVEQLRCLTDGDWSNDFPTCERKKESIY